jgi:hypothetical protein
MMAIRTVAAALGLLIGISCGQAAPKTKSAPPKTTKEKKMNSVEDIPYVPFGINKDTPLDQVEILLGFYSAKAGAGKQEIRLRGDGKVHLFFTKSEQDTSPKVLEGHCGVEPVLRLLDLMEGLGFFGLPEETPSHGHPHARRLLEVKVPGRFKRIALDEPGNYSIEQVIGAVKLAAGQCLPEALNHRFFPNL